MLEDVHQMGLCFDDVLLRSAERLGNLCLVNDPTTVSGYRIYWADVISISQIGKDEDKARTFVPKAYQYGLSGFYGRAGMLVPNTLNILEMKPRPYGDSIDKYFLALDLCYHGYISESDLLNWIKGKQPISTPSPSEHLHETHDASGVWERSEMDGVSESEVEDSFVESTDDNIPSDHTEIIAHDKETSTSGENMQPSKQKVAEIVKKLPGYSIVKDFSNTENGPPRYRQVWKVQDGMTGDVYKCYAFGLPHDGVVDGQLKKQIKRVSLNRWVEIGRNFPSVSKFVLFDAAEDVEHDLKCLLHSIHLVERNHSKLHHFVYKFSKIKFLKTETNMFVLQPWFDQDLSLPRTSGDPHFGAPDNPWTISESDLATRYQIINAFLTMFDALHNAGLCFYDVTIKSDLRGKGAFNICLYQDDQDKTYRCMWIDFESICQIKEDADKVAYLSPPPYENSLYYDYPSNIFKINVQGDCIGPVEAKYQLKEVLGQTQRPYGRYTDLFLLFLDLKYNSYLFSGQNFDDEQRFKNDILEPSKIGAHSFRFGRKVTTQPPSKPSTQVNPSTLTDDTVKAESPKPTSPTAPPSTKGTSEPKRSTDKQKAEKTENVSQSKQTEGSKSFTVSKRDKLVGISLIAISVVGYLVMIFGLTDCTDPSSVVMQQTESLYYDTPYSDNYNIPLVDGDLQFIEGVQSLKKTLDAQEDLKGTTVLKAMKIFLDAESGVKDGPSSCPIASSLTKEKQMAEIFTGTGGYDCKDNLQDLREMARDGSGELLVQMTHAYYESANCIHLLGVQKKDGKSQPFSAAMSESNKQQCIKAIDSGHRVLISSLPNWAIGEMGILWMAMINTDLTLITDTDRYDKLHDVCTKMSRIYNEEEYVDSIYSHNIEKALNRCLLTSKWEDVFAFAKNIHKHSDWSTQDWYDNLTNSRVNQNPYTEKGPYARVGRVKILPESNWSPTSEHAYYSWLATSIHDQKVAPLPEKLESGCWGWNSREKCQTVDDKHQWLSTKEAMKEAGY